ncbi:aa3-type cytochrome c oxidase subunit IV [Paracoccus sp. S1E-3]|nr:aa3-type cytochrome c oxidase subunit IV [Paracoccus sp. S1E-3]MBA4490745.1 aa3-type cytochrome c oxidase subunit IV [Paracoccus sp. S1E-3]
MAEHDTTQHVPGTMDIREHQKTFNGFLRFATWVVVLALGVLVFMALSNS